MTWGFRHDAEGRRKSVPHNIHRHPMHQAAVDELLANAWIIEVRHATLVSDICERYDMSRSAALTVLRVVSQVLRSDAGNLSEH